jgi:glycerol kinase
MSKEKFILAIDQGTSSSRAVLFTHSGKIKAISQKEVKQFYPEPAWVEQDAEEIWITTKGAISNVLKETGTEAQDVAAIGITNQRETTVVWDKKTGKPVYNAIVWQSRQSEEICKKVRESGDEEEIKNKTGLVVDPYFSASKLAWLFNSNPELQSRALNGELLCGTIDTWIIWNLTGGKDHITDYSNASRTLLFNIYECSWDKDLCQIFKVPEVILPKVVESSGIVAKTSKSLFGHEIPIAGIAGDQQAALFGQRCTKKGMAKNTYGTGCFMLLNTGDTPVKSKSGLLTTIAWKISGKVEYALEGGVFIGGAAIKWLRDGLEIIKKSSDSEELASKINSSEGVYVVPAFVGLGAPYWKSEARGAIFGLSLGTWKNHLIRATLESLAYQSKDLLNAMEADSGIKSLSLRVDGGACANNFLMQFQSDILGIPVERPEILETTAAGAAYLAGLGAGFWKMKDLEKIGKIEKRFDPDMENTERTKLYKGWKKAVEAVIGFSIKDPGAID